jgi:isopenicillin N synthase-like dioxygenase
MAPRRIPTIDLRALLAPGAPGERSRATAALGAGLTELGFVNVAGADLDAAEVARLYALWRRFFALPDGAKRRYVVGRGGARGYTPFGVEHAKDNPHPDLKEFWHVGQEEAGGEAYPPNVWPAEVPELREPTLALYRRLEACAAALLRALAGFFDLPRETFARMMANGNSILRVIHYPPQAPDADPRSVRAAAHEDINLITLLPAATDSGLEILTREGEWLPVAAAPGEIVVDAGDMLSRATNEVVPATTHRVVNPPGGARRDRYSMPFFAHPYPACPLDVIDRFVTPERPPRFPPTTAGEFLDERLREIGLKG